jgi:hypothetical protein
MAINHRTTVVGVFRDRSMVEQAMQALANAGFDPENIRSSGTGATGGFLDGIRSLLAGPTANDSNITNDLSGMGLSEEEARYYSGEHSNGNTILTVKAEGRDQEATSIMLQHGAYNYNTARNPQAAASYPQQPGGYAASSTAYTPQNSYASTNANATDSMRDPNATDPLDDAQPRSTQPVAPYESSTDTEAERVAQTTDVPAKRGTQMEDLQAQFQTMQQQLQEAQNQLKAAKEREQELQTARERETQYQTMQKQLQEMQAQLQATQAELRETQSRISQYN